MSEEMPKVT